MSRPLTRSLDARRAPQITPDTSTKTSDPDALQLQDAPLKQQGDKLEAGSPDRRAEKEANKQPPKRG